MPMGYVLLPRGEPTGIQVKLDKADVDGLTIEVDALGSIAGRVTRGGKPLDGVSVQPRPLDAKDRFERRPVSAMSDADGRFVVRRAAAGKYQLYAESKRVGAFTQGPVVNLAAGEDRAGVDIELELAGSIAGTVIDQKGAAVSGVHLRFSLMQGRDFGEATTADDGTFRAAALSGGGDYMFQVHAVPNSPLMLRPAAGTQFAPINVRDGNSQVTGVVIKVQFDRLSISGRVLAADGSPAADVSVTADRGNKARGYMGPTATTDTGGKFALKDLPAGKYAVYARSPSGFAYVEGVAAGTSNVDLRMPAVGAIEGTLEGFATSPSVFAFAAREDTMMMPYRLNATVTGTTFSFKRVPVGTYSLIARSKDGSARAEVTVDGKAVAKVVLRNPGSGTVEGRVVDETTREPVANLVCESEGSHMRSDASGAFRLERVTAGKATVFCFGDAIAAHASVMVEVGKTAHVDLAAKKWARSTGAGYAGLELAIVGSNVAVKKLVSGGPAERAGVKSGDLVSAVDDEEVDAFIGPQLVLMGIENGGPGATVKLTLEREGKPRTVELKLDARP